MPVIHDPRPAALLSALPEKDQTQVTYASQSAHWKPTPGTLILIPAYIMHEYVPQTKQPIKFIHFNVQAIEKRFR